MELVPGDIVRLKSGGPNMMVDRINEITGHVLCSWFDGSKRQHDLFLKVTLEKAVS